MLLCWLQDQRAIQPIVDVLHLIDYNIGVNILSFGTDAVPHLVDALKSEHEMARWNAAYLLGLPSVHDKRALEPLIALALDSGQDAAIRINAIGSLQRLGVKEAIESIESLLDDDDEIVREVASNSIAELKGQSKD